MAGRPASRLGSWGRAAAVAGVLGLAAGLMGVAGAQTGGDDRTASGAVTSESDAAVFVSIAPTRVLDTRPTDGGPIGVAAGKLGQAQTIDLALVGSGKPLPAEASSAVLNVTLDQDASLKSFLTIWPKGEARPNASANNAEPGMVAANSMIARLGADDSVSIYNHQGETNVIIDVVGYLVPADQVEGLGTQFLVGAAAPTGAAGDDGDMYLNATTNELYGPRTAGLWGPVVANLGDTGGTAIVSPSTPSGSCDLEGQVSFTEGDPIEDGEVVVCQDGSWVAPNVRSTIDTETSFGTLSESTELTVGGTTTLATFTAPDDGVYLLDSSITVLQEGFDPVDRIIHLFACQWIFDGTVEVGPAAQSTMLAIEADSNDPPGRTFLAPMGEIELDEGEDVELQCQYQYPGDADLAFSADWAYTAVRTPQND